MLGSARRRRARLGQEHLLELLGEGLHETAGGGGARVRRQSLAERQGEEGRQREGTHASRRRVLAGDEVAVDDDLGLPGLGPLKHAALLAELSLEQERDRRRPAGLLLLLVGEAGERLALDEGLAGRQLDVDKDGRRVADGRRRLARRPKGVDQLERVLVEREVDDGAVAARRRGCGVRAMRSVREAQAGSRSRNSSSSSSTKHEGKRTPPGRRRRRSPQP